MLFASDEKSNLLDISDVALGRLDNKVDVIVENTGENDLRLKKGVCLGQLKGLEVEEVKYTYV